MLKIAIYIICITSLLYVLVLLSRGLRKSSISTKLFFALAVFMFIWQVLLAVADFTSSSNRALISINLGFLSITIVSWLFLFFCLNYVKTSKLLFLNILASIWILITAYFAITNKIVNSVTISTYGAGLDKLSTFYYVDLVLINLLIIIGVVYLNLKKKNLDIVIKTQINLITIAVVVDLVGNLIGNELTQSVPSLVWMVQIANLANLAFVAIIAYTVIKHKLFDPRAAVARSVSYLFTISAVLLIYAVPLLIFTKYFLNSSLDSKTLVAMITVTFIVAIAFQPIKTYFNKLSNRFFYQDYYDPQVVLDQLGNLLVKSIRVEEILTQSQRILSAAIRPNRLDYLLSDLNTSDEDKELISELDKLNTNFIYTSDLDSNKNQELIKFLNKKEYILGIKLRTKDKKIGYMMLGFKKSGNIYNSSDRRFLVIAADEIAISLQNAINFAEIEKFNITLKEQIEEATKKLRIANAKLKLQDETKDDFISMASHQLRTPLTAVKGYVSLVLDGDAGKISPKQKEMLDQAFFGAQRMVYLISDLLNVSRVKTGKFIIEPTSVNLAEIIDEEVDQLRDSAKNRDLKLEFVKPKSFPVINIDETKTRQVIMNFLDNAIYYTPSGGEIEIKLSEDADGIELRIKDSGIGIAKPDQHHLFTKFYRADNAKKARPDGTGIGLYMAKKVIIAEGGSLIFESELGKGSTFGFRFSKKLAKS